MSRTRFWWCSRRGSGRSVIGGTLLVLARRWRAATAPQRRVLAPVLATGAVCLAVQAVSLAAQPASVRQSVGWVGALTFAAVPVSFLLGLLRQRLDRAAVGQLVVDLGEGREGDPLDALLRTALKDPSLQVAYWRPETQEYLGRGRTSVPDAGARRGASGHRVSSERGGGSLRWCTTLRSPRTQR